MSLEGINLFLLIVCKVFVGFHVLYVIVRADNELLFLIHDKLCDLFTSCFVLLIHDLLDFTSFAVNCTYDTVMRLWYVPAVHLPIHEIIILDRHKPRCWCFGYSIIVVGKVFLCHLVCNVCEGLRVCQGTRP